MFVKESCSRNHYTVFCQRSIYHATGAVSPSPGKVADTNLWDNIREIKFFSFTTDVVDKETNRYESGR